MNRNETFSYLELSTILEKWNHPQLQGFNGSHSSDKKRISKLRLLFPDTFNPQKTPKSSYKESHNNFDHTRIQLSKFLHGNVRNKSDISKLSNVTFCEILKDNLLSTDYITYSSEVEDAKNITPRDSMVNNIRQLSSTVPTPLDNKHPIFTEIPLTSENTFDDNLLTSIKMLLNKNTLNSLSYAIFLLILLSIYQTRIIEFNEFYTKKALNRLPMIVYIKIFFHIMTSIKIKHMFHSRIQNT